MERVGGDRSRLRLGLLEEDGELILHLFDVAPGHDFQFDRFVVFGEFALHLHLQLLAHFLGQHAQAELLEALQVDYAFLLVTLVQISVNACSFASRKARNTFAPVSATAISGGLRHTHRTISILSVRVNFTILLIVQQVNVDLGTLFIGRLFESARFLVWRCTNRKVPWRSIGFLNNGVLQILSQCHSCRLFELTSLGLSAHFFFLGAFLVVVACLAIRRLFSV